MKMFRIIVLVALAALPAAAKLPIVDIPPGHTKTFLVIHPQEQKIVPGAIAVAIDKNQSIGCRLSTFFDEAAGASNDRTIDSVIKKRCHRRAGYMLKA